MQELSSQISRAIQNHEVWKLRLNEALKTGGAGIDVNTVSRCDCCEFGRWLLRAEQQQSLGNTAPYRVISRLHAEFHTAAGAVVRATQARDIEGAKRALEGDFATLSGRLVKGLTKWLGEAQMRPAA